MSVNVGSVEVSVLPDASDFNKLLKARLANTPDVTVGVDTKKASAEVDKFVADTRVKTTAASKKTGEDNGGLLAQGMRLGFMKNSPLIAAAVAAGLAAGAPLVLAGASLMFGGIGALAVKSNAVVRAEWAATGADIKQLATQDAAALVPIYANMARDVGVEFHKLSPEIAQAFQASGPLVESFSRAILQAADVAMPGLVTAIKNAGPAVDGLDAFIVDVSKGFGDFLSTISVHAPAAGTALSSIGSILGSTLLPALGTLLGEGAELASNVLPPIASALHVVGGALNIVAPVLPEVAAGLLAMAAAKGLSSVLGSLASGLESVGAKAMVSVAELTGIEGAGLAAGTGFEAAASGARGLEAAMGPIGLLMAGISLVIPALVSKFSSQDDSQKQVKASAEAMNQALEASKGAIDDNVRATAAMQAQKNGLLDWANTWGVSTSTVIDAILGSKSAMAQVQSAAGEYANSFRGASKAQDESTTGAIAFNGVMQGAASASDKAAASILHLSGNTDSQIGRQIQLRDALQGTTNVWDRTATVTEQNATKLQNIANASSQASTQINILKGALDALTGKQVSETEAQIAVTQAANNAISSMKGLTGGLVDANGQLTVQTQAGAAAQQALIQLAGSDNTLIATMEKHGATSDVVAAKDAALRDQFIQTAEKMGYTAGQAQNLADQIYGIPTQRNIEIQADTSPAANELNALLKDYQNIKYTGSAIMVNGRVVANATGNILDTAPRMSSSMARVISPGDVRVIGDNPTSPEAFIPINDSARSSAILTETAARMGKAVVPMAAGGIVWDRATDTFPAQFGQGILTGVRNGMDAAVKGFAPVFSGGGGAARWTGVVEQVMAMLGLPQAALAGILNIIQNESGGNPNAINLTDSNARAGHPSQGLMQTIPSTFLRWAGALASRGITDPLANVYAGTNYALHTYGLGMLEGGGRSSGGRYMGYDTGGMLPPGPSLVYNGTGAGEHAGILTTQQWNTLQSLAAPGGGASGPTNMTVIAQFGNETIEATAVRVVDQTLGQVRDAVHYSGG